MAKLCSESHRWAVLVLVAAGAVSGCVAPEDEEVESEAVVGQTYGAQVVTIDPRRSLAVTEEAILARFPLERVLDQLVAQAGVPGLTSLALFQQWWDTQNPGPGVGPGPHCDDMVSPELGPVLNGFPYTCRPSPAEGALAGLDPFVDPGTNPEEYIAIGLFNRFDLTPADASSCGEHRIVYARRGGIDNARQRNLFIVEAALANPHPQQGLKGCKKVVEHWAALSSVADVETRADRLEKLYFDGIPSVKPVLHIDHLGAGPSGLGQIRTNQFMNDTTPTRVWSLREFKLRRTCAGSTCTALELVPVTVKTNPFGPLFSPGGTHALTADFQRDFLAQVPALAADTLAGLDMEVAEIYATGQSEANGTENNYVVQFGAEPSAFRDALAGALAAIESPLDPEHIVARAQALSCAGCHRLSNNAELGGGLVWPASLGFVHVSERDVEVVDGQPRFKLSDALVNEFLPKRKQVMEDYLNDKLKKPKKPKDPIGGRRVH
jgi:hypothetical protein